MLVMCNNVLNLLCNVSVFIDDEDDEVYTRKQWQWSVFRQSVVLSGFNMTWNTPHLRNLDFQDMSLFRSMILEGVKRHNPDVTPNGEKVHPTSKKYSQWSPLCQEASNQLHFYQFKHFSCWKQNIVLNWLFKFKHLNPNSRTKWLNGS